MNDGRLEEPAPIPADKARQGEIVLRRRWQRVVFVGGLALFVLFVFLAGLAYAHSSTAAGPDIVLAQQR